MVSSTNSQEAQPLSASLHHQQSDGSRSSLRVASEDGLQYVDVKFKRTVKVQDNDEDSFLPPDLGDMPLFSVNELVVRLRPSSGLNDIAR